MSDSGQNDFGLEIIHRPEKSTLDIVFVHGLFGSRRGSWTKGDVLWPQSLLPNDITNARIFLFGYDAGKVQQSHRNVEQTIDTWSSALSNALATERAKTKTEEHPIVFVAHSLGGLVCAEAFTKGDQNDENKNTALITAKTIGMVFLGTPFRGSKLASLGEILRRLGSAFTTINPTIGDLRPLSTRLPTLTQAYAQVIYKRQGEGNAPQLAFFYETKTIKSTIVVDQESSCIVGIGDHAAIEADHITMAKFSTTDDKNYEAVMQAILKVSSAKKPSQTGGRNTTVYGNIHNQVVGDNTGDMVAGDKVAGWKVGTITYKDR